MKQTFILTPDRETVINAIKTASDGMVVTIGPARRSGAQNDLSHEIYAIASQQLKDGSPLDYKCYAKLHFGVAILRAEDDEFREFYDENIKASFSYEQKLAMMKFLPVTSRMNKEQKSRYIDAVKEDFLARGVNL